MGTDHEADDHDGGLAKDMALMTRRRIVGAIGLAGAVGVAAYLLGGAAGGAEPTVATTGPDGAVCVKDPGETSGPFPADGTNARAGQTINALTQTGVVRDDLRASFAGLEGTAGGVALQIEIALVDVGAGCAPLAGHAIYLWHADAEGRYSLYDLPLQNYLRGVVVTDANGRATVTTIVPGCYNGRWPHIHFEVFSGLEAAVSGKDSLLTSQFAMPQDAVAAVYAVDARYPASKGNLAGLTVAGDMVFSDNTAEQIAAQTVLMTGDASAGFAGAVTVGIVVG
jgi:protocatechuate 3,4-dioxygenase beta subunit